MSVQCCTHDAVAGRPVQYHSICSSKGNGCCDRPDALQLGGAAAFLYASALTAATAIRLYSLQQMNANAEKGSYGVLVNKA